MIATSPKQYTLSNIYIEYKAPPPISAELLHIFSASAILTVEELREVSTAKWIIKAPVDKVIYKKITSCTLK